jgi:ferredoxin
MPRRSDFRRGRCPPANQAHFIALNAELSKGWPMITEKKGPLADAEEWGKVKSKLHLLER